MKSAQPPRNLPFTLSWSHYVELLTIKDPAERSFYEIEAANSSWSVPELRRREPPRRPRRRSHPCNASHGNCHCGPSRTKIREVVRFLLAVEAIENERYGCPSSGANELGIARKNGAYYLSHMHTISLKVPEHLLHRLEAESKARGTTKSSLVRECLERSLDPRSTGGKATCYDLARDLAGSVKGLPRDLATNPKHLEGFGQ